MVQYLFITNAE